MDGTKIFPYGNKYKGQTYEKVAEDSKYVDLIRKRNIPALEEFFQYFDASRRVLTILMDQKEDVRPRVVRESGPLPPIQMTDWSDQLGDQPFDHIVHVSDTHIRLRSRIEEYDYVFKQLEKSLKDFKDSGTKAIIVVTGDILHHQDHLSPDCVLRTLSYFESLSHIFPTIIIAGNHDCCVSNNQAADSLHAIFFNRQPQGLFYAQDRGRYRANNILFSVLSRVGEHRNITVPWEADNEAEHQVVLYHGPVEGAMKADGTPSHEQDRAFRKLSEFMNYDLVLLGDYHTYQHPGGHSHVAYAGSMICQNFGEVKHPHGYVLWNTATKTAHHIPLQNIYDHVLVDLDKQCYMFSGKEYIGELSEVAPQLPSRGKFRLSYIHGFDEGKLHEFKDRLQKYCPSVSQEWRLLQTTLTEEEELVQSFDLQSGKLTSIIKTFLLRDRDLSVIPTERQDQLNEEIDQLLRSQDIISTTTSTSNVELLEVKWSNVLTYGEDNVIDFRSIPLQSIMSLTAPNSFGKSSLVDIILFSLYGQFERGEKTLIANNRKANMTTTATLKIGGDLYTINRTARRNQNTGLTEEHKVTFYKGQQNITGAGKTATDQTIINTIGSYNNFVRLCICFQTPKDKPLWGLTPSQRRSYLGNFHSVNLVALNTSFNMKEAELQRQYERIENNINRQSRTVTEKLIDEARCKLTKVMELKDQRESELGRIQQEVRVLDSTLGGRPLSTVLRLLNQEQHKLQQLQTKVTSTLEELLEERRGLTLLEREDHISAQHLHLLENIELETASQTECDEGILGLHKSIEDLLRVECKLQNMIHELNSNKAKVTHVQWTPALSLSLGKKMAALEQKQKVVQQQSGLAGSLRYDPSCECCSSNKGLLTILPGVDELDNIQKEIEASQKEIEAEQVVQRQYEEAERVEREIDRRIMELKDQIYKGKNVISNKESEMRTIKDNIRKQVEKTITEGNEYEALRAQKKRYQDINMAIQDINNLAQIQITMKELIQEHDECLRTEERRRRKEKYQYQASEVESEIRLYHESIGELNTDIRTQERRIAEIDMLTKEKSKVGSELQIYKRLTKLTSKDGPLAIHILQGHFLPQLEGIVNRLLVTVLNRSVSLHLKGQDDLNINFIDSNGMVTSTLGGMESLMHDLAFRVALSQLALVPRYNLLIIDEGISVLDKEKIVNIDTLFEFFRTVFKHTIVITHLDGITDHVDSHMTIRKDANGFSKLITS